MPVSARALLLAWDVLERVPAPVARALAGAGGALAYGLDRRRRSNLRANLLPVMERSRGGEVPARQVERAVRRGFSTYARYWAEAFQLGRWSPERLDAATHASGVEELDRARAGGRGVILAAPHLGNWDAGGAWLASRLRGEGVRVTAVAERLRPEAVFRRFVGYRARLGLEVVPLGEPGGTSVRLVRALRAGGVVGLVADRDLTGRGVPVTMFGRRVTLPAGPAVLALRTGAPLLPAALYQRPGGGWQVVFRPPLPVPDVSGRQAVGQLTQALADELAALIAAAPEQWHVLMPFWPAQEPAPGTFAAGPGPRAAEVPGSGTSAAAAPGGGLPGELSVPGRPASGTPTGEGR